MFGAFRKTSMEMEPIRPDSLPGFLASPGSAAIFHRPEEKVDPQESVIPFRPRVWYCDPIPMLANQSPLSLKDVVVQQGQN